MADLFRTCRDGHRCENNALCLEAPNDEGSYYCDCSTAGRDVAGLSCEFEAEVFCQAPSETTSTHFCTNRGTCVRSMNAWRCDCPPEFEGAHCEYIAGARPDDWPTKAAARSFSPLNAKGGGLETGVTVAIVLVSIAVTAMMGFMVMRSIRRREDVMDKDELDGAGFRKAGKNAPKDHSEALNIEMDGTGFRDAVRGAGTSNGNGFSYDHEPEIDSDSEMGSQVESPTNGSGPRKEWAGQML